MEIKDFGVKLAKETEYILGDKYNVQYKEIIKNNKVPYNALIINKAAINIAPTIYIDSLFDEYEKGAPMLSLVNQVIALYKRSLPPKDIDMSFFMDFAKVAPKLAFKVVNYYENEDKLDNIPYKRFEDLALLPICLVNNSYIGKGTIVIQNDHLKKWEITRQELWENVMEYCAGNCGLEVKTIWESISECGRDSLAGVSMSDLPTNIFVITNEQKMYGAAAIFYPNMLKTLARQTLKDLIILPSSVHECIAMAFDENDMNMSELVNIVREVNSSVLSKEEILSNNIYIYRRAEDRLKMYLPD